jgi:hypothetical protein
MPRSSGVSSPWLLERTSSMKAAASSISTTQHGTPDPDQAADAGAAKPDANRVMGSPS